VAAGSKLPPRTDLAAAFAVSPVTMRQGLARLDCSHRGDAYLTADTRILPAATATNLTTTREGRGWNETQHGPHPCFARGHAAAATGAKTSTMVTVSRTRLAAVNGGLASASPVL